MSEVISSVRSMRRLDRGDGIGQSLHLSRRSRISAVVAVSPLVALLLIG